MHRRMRVLQTMWWWCRGVLAGEASDLGAAMATGRKSGRGWAMFLSLTSLHDFTLVAILRSRQDNVVVHTVSE